MLFLIISGPCPFCPGPFSVQYLSVLVFFCPSQFIFRFILFHFWYFLVPSGLFRVLLGHFLDLLVLFAGEEQVILGSRSDDDESDDDDCEWVSPSLERNGFNIFDVELV